MHGVCLADSVSASPVFLTIVRLACVCGGNAFAKATLFRDITLCSNDYRGES